MDRKAGRGASRIERKSITRAIAEKRVEGSEIYSETPIQYRSKRSIVSYSKTDSIRETRNPTPE